MCDICTRDVLFLVAPPQKGKGTCIYITMVSVWLVVCLLACLLVDSLQIFFPISEILSEQL